MGIIIEPLGAKHDRTAFSCGQSALDDWFRRRAGQDEKRNVARVFVAVDDERSVLGFYSLSSFTLTLDDLPDEIARKLPRYEAIPAALIGRLGRDQKARGRGIRELLLADAVRRILNASRTPGSRGGPSAQRPTHRLRFNRAGRARRLLVPLASLRPREHASGAGNQSLWQ